MCAKLPPIVRLHILRPQSLLKCFGFSLKAPGLPGGDGILCGFHLQEFFVGDFQEIGQGKLLVDAVRTVKTTSVCPHYTTDALRQIAFQRVPPQVDDIIQPHIAGKLEFQYHIVGFYFFQ